MAQITFQYGSWTPAFTPVIRYSKTIIDESVIDVSGTQVPKAYRVVLDATFTFIGTQDQIIAQWEAARAALETQNQDLTLKRDADVIISATSSNAPAGVMVRMIGLPNLDRAELANILTVDASFEATVHADGYPNVWSNYRIETTDENGTFYTRVTGVIEGEPSSVAQEYLDLFETLRVGQVVIRKSQMSPSDNRRIEFQWEFALGTPERYEWNETITISYPVRQAVVHTILGESGMPNAEIQQTGWLPCEITESGSMLGRNNYPAAPPSRFPSYPDASPPVITRRSPRRTVTGTYTDYRVEWSYQKLSQTAPVALPAIDVP